MHSLRAIIVCFSLFCLSVTAAEPPQHFTLAYAPAPLGNPLIGLVPYHDSEHKDFPHSLEFNYLNLSDLVVREGKFNWRPMEKLLDDIASRGHQAVVRVALEYPGQTGILPKYLVDAGLKYTRVTNEDGIGKSDTPDYNDPRLRKLLVDFIAEWGRKYDGDPRLGFITAGLLGKWGEWHTYPQEKLFASRTVQREVLDAYERSFKTTRVLLRYPAGKRHPDHAENARRPFGYHDDSFGWLTLETGKESDDWSFVPLLKTAGAVEKWRTQPIGGEIRPEAWGKIFDAKPRSRNIQNFTECVGQTHASWLMDSGMFRRKQPAERIERAREAVRRMGYELYVSKASITPLPDNKWRVSVTIENRGVAPFYYDWPVEYALADGTGKIVERFPSTGKVVGIQPETKITWRDELTASSQTAGEYRLLLRVKNPLPNGVPLRFANTTQDADVVGYLTVGKLGVD